MWYRRTLARHRAEVNLARQRLLPAKPESPIAGGNLSRRMKRQDLYALLAGGFAAAMILGPARAAKLATRGAALAGALLPPPRGSDPAPGTTEVPPPSRLAPTEAVSPKPRTHDKIVHLNGKTPAQPISHTAPYTKST